MQIKTITPMPYAEPHHIHLAASGAPTLDIPVQFADEASKAFCTYREKYEFGASEMDTGCGNIYNSRGVEFGK